ncbi:MAG: hypothetical protein KF819_31500 [Labilithrix sp.]|nr:hypothetical protein [Labilithrix sp.]
MGLGFELSEAFSGSYYLLDEPLRDHAIRLSLHVSVDGLRRFVIERKAQAEGLVFVEGIAERDPAGVRVNGTVTMKLFDEKRIPYDLSFEGDDGRAWRLRGQRDFFMHDAVDSLTILPASLYDDRGVESGRAILRFDPKTELAATVRSFRPRLKAFRLSGA